jgi:hypothetical protein
MRYEKPEIEEIGEANKSVTVILTLNQVDFEPSTYLFTFVDPCPWWYPLEW